MSAFQSLKQAWIKAANLYWLGCVINPRRVVVVVVVAVVVLSAPAAAEGGGWLKRECGKGGCPSGVERGECGKGGCPSGVRSGSRLRKERMCRAPSQGATESRVRAWSHAPLQVSGLGVRCCGRRWESGGGPGERRMSATNVRLRMEFFIRGGEKFMPKVGLSAHPGAGNKGEAGFLRPFSQQKEARPSNSS